MPSSPRFVKTMATTLCGALAAYAVATGLAEPAAHAQISGTIGGDVVERPLIEDAGTFFEAQPSGELVDGEESASQAPGFMDYTDDACRLAEGGVPGATEPRACALVSQTPPRGWRAR